MKLLTFGKAIAFPMVGALSSSADHILGNSVERPNSILEVIRCESLVI
jgi:hypothetical protein